MKPNPHQALGALINAYVQRVKTAAAAHAQMQQQQQQPQMPPDQYNSRLPLMSYGSLVPTPHVAVPQASPQSIAPAFRLPPTKVDPNVLRQIQAQHPKWTFQPAPNGAFQTLDGRGRPRGRLIVPGTQLS